MIVEFNFASGSSEMEVTNPEFARLVLFSDEALFKMNGEMKRHNCRYWAKENHP